MSVPNLTNLGQPVANYQPDTFWSIYQYVDSHCDLDL